MLEAMVAGRLGLDDEAMKSADMIALEQWQARRTWGAVFGSEKS